MINILRNVLKYHSSEKLSLDDLTVDILVKSLKTNKCLVLINDKVYIDVLKYTFMQIVNLNVTYFQITVEESEDLLLPNPLTQQILKQAKNEFCQLYLILISNAYQSSRLLQFGDRYRVLDTRAKFVMLYDLRLFDKKFYYLWKRIINVVFIREYRSNTNKNVTKIWYELSTVPFPTAFKGSFISKHLDMWKNMKFRKGVELFENKFNDLKNNTLKILSYEHMPSTLKVESAPFFTSSLIPIDDLFFTGIEIEIINTLSKVMNFTASVYEKPSVETKAINGNVSLNQYPELREEMRKSNVDFVLGGLHHMLYNLDIMDLSIPYNAECLTFLTPESLTDIAWKTLIRPFPPIMWLFTIIVLMVCMFIFVSLAKFHSALNWESSESSYGLFLFRTVDNGILYTYSMMLLVSLPKLPERWSLRVMTGWFWIYAILLVVAYRASMTAILANPATRITIDTMNELVDSKLPCGGPAINLNFFISSQDDALQKIGTQFQPVNDTQEATFKVMAGKFAFYESVQFLKAAVANAEASRTNRTGDDNGNNVEVDPFRNEHPLHIMKDCVINMPISIGLQKNSPLKEKVDTVIRLIFEAGLVQKWMQDIMQTVLKRSTSSEESEKALMDLKKFYGGLVVLGIGYLLGFVALFGELLYFHFRVRKHPDFNKYTLTVVKMKE